MRDFRGAFQNRRVLINGGLGFIGSNLARRLVELSADITIVDSMIPEYGGNLFNVHDISDHVKINFADIRDGFSMHHLVQKQEFIFNLAGQVSHLRSMTDPFPDLDINCRAQLSLLEACRHNNPDVKVLFAGTRGQYGRVQSLPVNENHPMNPVDVNGINNIAGEQYHILYNKIYGLRTTSLRLTNTYGPRHSMKSDDQSFLNWLIRRAIEGHTIQVYGDGSQKRDFNYVDDVVEAFLLAAVDDRTNGAVFNLGGPEPVSVLEVAKLLLEVMGSGKYEVVPFPENRRMIEIGDYWGDYTKIKNLLGWAPTTTLKDGLRKTVDFYKQHKQHYWTEGA
ncbi:GDP-mannose 4,6-dehydratase [bacterium]|nr:GDP-mannose 4,6-dehydratase [bacterium]